MQTGQRARLVEAGVEIGGEPWDSGVCKGVGFHDPDGNGLMLQTSVCRQAWFEDPDGNALMLHRRFDV